MAIRLITGVLGAGKTYLAVNHIAETYFDYDSSSDLYKKKPEYSDLTIISNIDGLLLDHIPLDLALQKSNKTIETFFTTSNQEKIGKKYPKIIYFIDEAQQYFRNRFYNNDVFAYFEYCRHLGHDIYLITQHRKKLAWDIQDLAEYELRAVPRTLSFAGELKYNMIVNGDIVERKGVKPKKRIYQLYKSMNIKETEKQKKPLIKYIAVPLFLLIPSSWFLISQFQKKLDPPPENKNIHTQSEIKTPIQTVNTPKNSEPIIFPSDVWISIDGVIKINNRIYKVLDPITGELVSITSLTVPVRIQAGKVQVRMPLDYVIQKRESETDSNRSNAQYKPEKFTEPNPAPREPSKGFSFLKRDVDV
jgi:hypothetical protein